MAISVGSLLVSLGIDSAEFKSGMNQAEKDFRRSTKRIEAIGKSMVGVGRNLSLAVTAPLAALGVASFKAASDVAEMQGAFDVSFGAMADSVRAWSAETGKELGRSRFTIQEAALAFNELFSKALDPARAAEMSKQFAVLTQDLASFKNLSDEVAQQKLFSGLTGEAEPLRAVGVFINEAATSAKALELGMVQVNGAFTDQQKIIARAALIQEQLANAQGDVVRTSDQTANQMRASAEAFKDFRVAIGNVLLALTPLIKMITDLLQRFNSLSPGVQKAIVVTAGLAAAMGPLLIVMGSIVKVLAPFVAGIKLATTAVAAAGVTTTTWTVSLAVLRATILTLVQTLAPYVVVLGTIGALIAALVIRHRELTTASEKYRKAQTEATKAAEKGAKAARDLAVAQGEARKEALAAARAEQKNLLTKLKSAQASLQLAKAEYIAAKAREDTINQSAAIGDTSGILFGSDQAAKAETNLKSATASLKEITAALREVNAALNAPAPNFGDSPVLGGGSSGGGGRGGASGPSAAEIEQRFNDELAAYAQQALSSMAQLATSADERAEYELRSVELARIRTEASIKADQDYSAVQKERLIQAVDELAERERAAIEYQRLQETERDLADMARIEFDNQRELLALQGDVAETQIERKRIALQILELEQEYRRNQMEMVLASKTASDAEKARARAILDSLSAIEAGERAAVSRGNETDVERYIRDLNKSPEQINEAIDRIKINGLESLNDALVDAVVNFKSLADVAKSVVQSILAELLRLQIQQAIIRPLAGALGLAIPGFAKGTNFAPGGLALVGERGPELVNLPRGSQVIPNNELSGMGGGAPVFNITVSGAMSDRDARRTGQQIASAASQRMAQARRAGVAG